MLSDRAQALLKTLIERYIVEGQPVGSRTLSRYAGLELSPASIRNVMADLEEQGFIASPHISAGRVPTARGYRYFVDTLLRVQPLEAAQIQHIEAHLSPHDPQLLATYASQLLSDLTRFAGIVVVPKRKGVAVRQIEFLGLSEKRVLLIIITNEGEVQNRVLATERPYSPQQLVEASNFLTQHYAGLTFEQMEGRLRDELASIRRDMTMLMNAVLEAGKTDPGRENFVISGERNLLNVEDIAGNLVSLKKLFEVFEHKTELLQLLDISQKAQGVQIFIGGEAGIAPLDEFSVVAAPYEANGEIVGTVGVVGPTRMAYDRVIPIVDITARLLSSALSFH